MDLNFSIRIAETFICSLSIPELLRNIFTNFKTKYLSKAKQLSGSRSGFRHRQKNKTLSSGFITSREARTPLDSTGLFFTNKNAIWFFILIYLPKFISKLVLSE